MAEFVADALSLVGNFSGPCLIYLNGESITVKRSDKLEIAKWPYNCIRQFRAEEEAGKFSFVSGRRGPYGVAEYNFGLTGSMLAELQEALTQFTGAQFSTVAPGSGSGENPPPVPTSHRPSLPGPLQSSTSMSSISSHTSLGSVRTDSTSSERGRGSIDGSFVSPIHSRGQHHAVQGQQPVLQGPRLPPRDYLPGSPLSTAPLPVRHEDGRYSRSPGGRSSNPALENPSDLTSLPEIPPKPQSMSPPTPSQAHDHTPAPPAQPHTSTQSPHHESLIMKSHMYETRKPVIKAKPDLSGKVVRGQTSPDLSGKGVRGQSPPVAVKRSSLKKEETESPQLPPKYVSTSNLQSESHQLTKQIRKQQTEPALTKATPTPQAPPTQSNEEETTQRKSPYDHLKLGQENEDSHNQTVQKRSSQESPEPTPSDSAHPPGSPDEQDCSNLDYLPRCSPLVRVRSITPEYAQHLQHLCSVEEDGDVIINKSPTIKGRRSPEDKFKRSQTVGVLDERVTSPKAQDTYDVPKRLVKQYSADDVQVDSHYHVPKPSTNAEYHIPRPYDDSLNQRDYYHQPKPAAEVYKVPKPYAPGVGVDTYDFPRMANQAEGDHSLYNTPRSIADSIESDNLYTNIPRTSSDPTQDDTYNVPRTPTAAKLNAVSGDPSRQLPGNPQETYSVPPRRTGSEKSGPYETVDPDAPRGAILHKLRSARSFESLASNRINPKPAGSHISPPEHADGHNMYVDIDRGHSAKLDSDNLYAEIPADYIPRRGQTMVEGNHNRYVPVPSASIPPAASQGMHQRTGAELYDQLPTRQDSLMQKQRQLASEGYELCLPAEVNPDSLRMMTLPTRGKRSSETPPRTIPRDANMLDKYDIHLPAVKPTRPHSEADLIESDSALHRSSMHSADVLGTSNPSNGIHPNADEYVIITHRDTRPKFLPSQPQGIPGQGVPQPSVNASTQSSNQNADFSDEYQVMSAVKINRSNLTYDTPNPIPVGNGHQSNTSQTVPDSELYGNVSREETEFVKDVKYETVNAVDFRRLPSESGLDMEGVSPVNPRPIDQQRAMSFSSMGSVFSDQGSEVEGQDHVSSLAMSIPQKARMRIASGSPRDSTGSLDLRNRSRSLGNVLEQDAAKKHNYVNVSEDGSSTNDSEQRTRGSSLATTVIKKPPMPLPKPSLAEEVGEFPNRSHGYEFVDIKSVKGNSHPLSSDAQTPQ